MTSNQSQQRTSMVNKYPEIYDRVAYSVEHLGLIKGLLDKFQFVSTVNQKLPKKAANSRASSGDLLFLAMLHYLSGDIPGGLYGIERFATKIPISFFSSLKAEESDQDPYHALNRYAIADMLDGIAEYGPSRFSSEVIATFIDPSVITTAHLDSTSFHFHGSPKYRHSEELTELCKGKRNRDVDNVAAALSKDEPQIAVGYSRDHQSDLPQCSLLGVSAWEKNVHQYTMIYEADFDGNKNDKSRFQEFSKNELTYLQNQYPYLKQLVADSVVATVEFMSSCKASGIDIVTRLPDSQVKKYFKSLHSKERKLNKIELPLAVWEGEEEPSQKTISYTDLGIDTYISKDNKKIELQRVLFRADEVRPQKTATQTKKAEKELEATIAKLKKLEKTPYACREDAEKDFKEASKKLKYVVVDTPCYEEILGYKSKGRPTKGAKKEVIGVRVIAHARIDPEKLNAAIDEELYYVIATTDINKRMSKENVCALYMTYHHQVGIESQWLDMKAAGLFFDPLYLKTPRRTSALMAVISISLAIGKILISHVHKTLKQYNLSLSSGTAKKYKKPQLNTFIKFIQSHREDTLIVLENSYISIPPYVQSTILYKVASVIGPEAMKYYQRSYYEEHFEQNYITSCLRQQQDRNANKQFEWS